jgi:hypothetical protein
LWHVLAGSGLIAYFVGNQEQLADTGEQAAKRDRRSFLDAVADLRDAHVTLPIVLFPRRAILPP